EKKLTKSTGVGADVLILDLEDAVPPVQKARARLMVRDYLNEAVSRAGPELWVRVNSVETPDCLADLAAVIPARPAGIVQPKPRSVADVMRLGHYLDALEAAHGVPAGSIGILPIATEMPGAIFSLGGYSTVGPRLRGLTWGAEDLSAAVGAITNKNSYGDWAQPYQLARALCLFAAAAAEVSPIDTLHADFRDISGLRSACAAARGDGFVGKLAIHPDQVPIINETFLPTAEEIAAAERLVQLFAANPTVGVLQLDGKMFDIAHLRQAQRTLARAQALDLRVK
ncbi:MAG: CoA ester lyase, partial [Steroidobacteraceae bacterium]|nr:CoA ester lyase [Steroidobacteraceae bacterium]